MFRSQKYVNLGRLVMVVMLILLLRHEINQTNTKPMFSKERMEYFRFVRAERERLTWVKGRRARILFLGHHYEYTNFMDRSFYHQYSAALRHPYVDAVLWGVGLPGWNINLTIAENIATRYGSATYFDVVFVFHFDKGKNEQVYELGRAGVIVTQRECECFDSRCMAMVEWNNPSVLQLSYMTDMHYYYNLSKSIVMIHSPHCAEPDLFYRRAEEYREHDFLLAGAINVVYPLRKRWLKLSEDGRLSIYRRNHPGYFLDSFNPNPEWSSADAEKVEKLEAQVKQYADDMKRSKIMLTDSSVYRYALMKYIEATMAGCLIIGDIPFDFPDLFRQIVVEVNKDDSDDYLVAAAKYWLDHEEERIKRVRRAQQLIFPEFTWDTSIDRLIQGANMYQKKQYGIYYSGSFIQSCTAKNALKGFYTNNWCSNDTEVK